MKRYYTLCVGMLAAMAGMCLSACSDDDDNAPEKGKEQGTAVETHPEYFTSNVYGATCYNARMQVAVGEALMRDSALAPTTGRVTVGVAYSTDSTMTKYVKKAKSETVSVGESAHFVLRSLAGGKHYYCRPYVITDRDTIYDSVKEFDTQADNIVATGEMASDGTITSTLVCENLEQSILDTISTRCMGVCYDKDQEAPVVAKNSRQTAQAFDGTYFTGTIDRMRYITLYYRAFVIIDNVAHYGEVRLMDRGNGHNYVNLGNITDSVTVYWATMDVGATQTGEAGDFFAWGDTIGCSGDKVIASQRAFNWSDYVWYNKNYHSMNRYNAIDCFSTLVAKDDAAQANWRGDWRMPTREELAWLMKNCTWTKATSSTTNGYKIKSKTTQGYIYLPAAGYCKDNALCRDNLCGGYWSSNCNTSDYAEAYDLYFDSSHIMQNSVARCVGRCVRPVITVKVK